jgi:hypothetical protein
LQRLCVRPRMCLGMNCRCWRPSTFYTGNAVQAKVFVSVHVLSMGTLPVGSSRRRPRGAMTVSSTLPVQLHDVGHAFKVRFSAYAQRKLRPELPGRFGFVFTPKSHMSKQFVRAEAKQVSYPSQCLGKKQHRVDSLVSVSAWAVGRVRVKHVKPRSQIPPATILDTPNYCGITCLV